MKIALLFLLICVAAATAEEPIEDVELPTEIEDGLDWDDFAPEEDDDTLVDDNDGDDDDKGVASKRTLSKIRGQLKNWRYSEILNAINGNRKYKQEFKGISPGLFKKFKTFFAQNGKNWQALVKKAAKRG